MCFTGIETQNFILKLREIFPWRETLLMDHRVKFNEKDVFYVKSMRFFVCLFCFCLFF